jgi:hypothetical protein
MSFALSKAVGKRSKMEVTQEEGLDMIAFKLVYVPSALNVADAPSRGLSSPALLRRNRIVRNFDLPADLEGVFDVRPPR